MRVLLAVVFLLVGVCCGSVSSDAALIAAVLAASSASADQLRLCSGPWAAADERQLNGVLCSTCAGLHQDG